MAMQLSGSINLNGSLTGSILADNGLVSSSQQITNYYKFAETSSANTFYGNQTISGSLVVSETSEFGGDLVPKEARGATIGTLERPFRDIYLQSASINIASDIPGGRNATISNADGNVSIAAAGFQLKSGSFVSFEVSEDARVKIKVPIIPAGDIGAFSIIGNASGTYQPITSAGGMVHITGNDGQVNRFNMDAFGSGSTNSFNGIIARAARGTVVNPTQTKTGDVILRLTGTGWRGDTGFGGTAIVGGSTSTLDFVALEDQMNNSRGSAQQFYNAPIGTNNRVLSAQIDTTGLFVSGAFTSSLSQGYIWVGGNGNATILVPTASFATTGSNTFIGNQTITGSLTLSSGSALRINNGFYVDGNRQFNYGQWCSLETQTGSANTAYSMKLETQTDGLSGFYVGNNASGFPTRIYAQNTGLYNLQFSAQLHTTSNEACDFSVWFAMTGSSIANSNTDFSIEKIAGGGFQVAALNFLTPITSGSYVELYWSKTTANGQLQAKGTQVSPTRPATPSLIVTVTQVA
jgi:hypothetical protein